MSIRTISESEPVARKPHTCNACELLIEPGERYVSQRNVDSRDAWTYKAHRACRDFLAGLDLDDYEDPDPMELRDLMADEAADFVAAADRGEGPMTKRPDTTWLRDLAAVRANVTSDPKAGDMLLSYADFIDGAHDWANDGSCVFCDRCGIELPIEDDAGRITDTLASTCEGSVR